MAHHGRGFRRTTIVAAVVAAMTSVAVGQAIAAQAGTTARATAAALDAVGNDWSGEPLLLIHGFTDTCQAAWQTPDNSGLPGDTTAATYLGNAFSHPPDQVGYYTQALGGGQSADVTTCSEDINHPVPQGSSGCNNLPDVQGQNTSQFGSINDHIDRLACLLAWYIYDTYTAPSSGTPEAVNVLAHSMGGLIIQDAIGATSKGVTGFPPHPLRVLRVVTVATPHGGIGYPYYQGAQQAGLDSNELSDMGVGSPFLTTLDGYGKPRGTTGTFWGLIGASDSAYFIPKVGCPHPPAGYPLGGGNYTSCAAMNAPGATQPDGDGVVPSVSQMSMPADVKVLYGIADGAAPGGGNATADPNTQYEHEVNTQAISGSLNPPFYLNDGRTGTTQAFTCTSNCTATSDYSDLNLSSPATVPYSLAEISNLLETPVVKNISGGGQFATVWQAAAGPLGEPLGYYYTTNGGQAQDFQYGTIYWSSLYGTHAIYGPAYTDYSGLGGPASVLGFPKSDAISEPAGGLGWSFPGTSCGATGITGFGSTIMTGGPTDVSGRVSPASEMQGCIYQAYSILFNGPGGVLGYPTTNERPMGTGRVNYFTGGTTKPGCSTGSEPADGISTAAIYWNGTAHAVTGCIFAEYHSVGEATGELGFPTDDAYAVNGGHRQDFQKGFISGSNGSYSVTLGGSQWVVGHAQHAGNDYPYETLGQFDHQNEGTDAWNEYYGQCDSFAAWKVYENLYGSQGLPITRPSIVPAPGWTPPNASVSPVNQNTWYNADNWDVKWPAQGYAVNTVPVPGSIAYWPNATTDPQDGHPADSVHGIGEFGHVGYVTDVYPDGSVTIESYNLRLNGEYSTIHLAYGQSATDTSFNQGAFTVPWPKYFIHVADGPFPGEASPPEPANGTVAWGYPTQVKVIGPGSPSTEFSLGNVWYPRGGHGEIGEEQYTHTNGPTAVSTATWTPTGLAASTCYRVDAFVPDNYSDNPTAIYTVTDATGTSYAAVNENVQTNDWSELGVFITNGSGTGLSVKLDDRGVTGLFVAADAMRFWKQANCNNEANVSPIFGPSSYYNTWSLQPGHGFFGTERYTTTTGTSSSDHSATWTPAHLIPYGCYDVSLYVPDYYSDNPGALYFSNDAYYGVFYPQIDENAYTNQFAWTGTFQANSDGTLPVELFNEGPSGDYVAADAIAYVLNPHCMTENGAANAFGSAYTSSIIGPGSGPPDFSTTSDWYSQIGHGYANHQLWTYTNGATPVSTATWTFYGTANACYTASAYIPINSYANNPNASYTFNTQAGVVHTQINQAVSNGWTQFQGNPKITTGSNGQITVSLNDTGPVGTYTAADAISFNQTSC